jgi:hypothetical protein
MVTPPLVFFKKLSQPLLDTPVDIHVLGPVTAWAHQKNLVFFRVVWMVAKSLACLTAAIAKDSQDRHVDHTELIWAQRFQSAFFAAIVHVSG